MPRLTLPFVALTGLVAAAWLASDEGQGLRAPRFERAARIHVDREADVPAAERAGGDLDCEIAAPAAVTSTSDTREVRGQVLLEGGGPAPGAIIAVYFSLSEWEGSDEAVSDEDGRFVLSLPSGWHCALAATEVVDGYQSVRVAVEVPEAGAIPELIVRLPRVRYSAALLRILDSDGRPAAGVTVSGVRTDSEGWVRIEFRDAPCPERAITISEDGLLGACCASAIIATHPPDAVPEQVISLPERKSVRVVVLDPDGVPLRPSGSSTVRAWFRYDAQDLAFDSVSASYQAHYRAWPDEGVAILIDEPEFVYEHRTERRPRPEVRIRLQRPGVLIGRVVDHRGAPMHDQPVQWGPWTARTDSDGRFEIDRLPTGAESLVVFGGKEPDCCMVFNQVVTIAAGERCDIGEIHAARLRPIVGHVVDAKGRAIVGAKLRATGPPLQYGGDTETGGDGSFRIDVPDSQPWRLTVQSAGHGTALVPAVMPGDAKPIRVVAQPECCVRIRASTTTWRWTSAYRGDVRIPIDVDGELLRGLPEGVVRIELSRLTADNRIRLVGVREVQVTAGQISEIEFP